MGAQRIGSLFSGIGGLELGLSQLGEVAWQVENALAPRAVLARQWPEAVRYGDVKEVDWSQVEPVDVLAGGPPCQPVSQAGSRKGSADERWLWGEYFRALRALTPRVAVAENVSGLRNLGLSEVLEGFEHSGYDVRWITVPASMVGAPHRRLRMFMVATPRGEIDPLEPLRNYYSSVSDGNLSTARAVLFGDLPSAVHPASGRMINGRCFSTSLDHGGESPTRILLPTPVASDANGAANMTAVRAHGDSKHHSGKTLNDWMVLGEWDAYVPAMGMWEAVIGRSAPAPVVYSNGPRLSPAFVEWMMGFPEGWTSGMSRTQALKALGNSVVPQWASYCLYRTNITAPLAV